MSKQRRAEAAKVVVGYARVSTTGQATEGVSLEAQKERIRSWAAANGLEVAAVHVDAGLSGKRADNRPGLQRALADVLKRRGVLVAYSLSRLARSVTDAYEITRSLEQAGAQLALITEAADTRTASGRMFLGMLCVLAQFERELIGERTAAAMAHKRKQGRRISGQAPLGYRFEGGDVVPDDSERAVLDKIKGWRAEDMTLRAIVERLNEERVPARGSRWHLRGVQLALAA